MDLSLLLLAHNESETIKDEIFAWRGELEKLPSSVNWEIVVSEDGSVDGTTELLLDLTSKGFIRSVHNPKRLGYSQAFLMGLHATQGQFIFFSDTGGKNDVNDFWALYFRRNLADLIVGHKVLRTDQFYRRFLTHALNFFLRRYFRNNLLHDSDSGFRIFNKQVKDLIFEKGTNFSGFIGSEISLKVISANLRFMEVPIRYYGRAGISRGLPLKAIPKSVARLLLDARNLRYEIRNLGQLDKVDP
jgi:glycosyltransferase involved in cell wall biosynthesis